MGCTQCTGEWRSSKWTCSCPCNWFFISYYTWKCLKDVVLPTVVRHFALYAQKIFKMAEIMGINATGDALKDADAVANAIHVFCQELGLDTLQKIFAEKGYCDNCREFTEK